MHVATTIKRWTLEEVHSLPDDGNKYELVRGVLFVTPAPSVGHEEIAAVLTELLQPYVTTNRLGRVYRPRAVIRGMGSEVEPDLMVRSMAAGQSWADAPLPILVIEIVSGATRRRDHIDKRRLYLDLGIPDYWIVDGAERSVRIVRPHDEDIVVHDMLVWAPGTASPLSVDLPQLFRAALGPARDRTH